MSKNFDEWNKEKKRLHETKNDKLYHEREMWWCSLGENIGFEQNGTGKEHQRPVLILKGMSRETCYIVPLTTSSKLHKHRVSVGLVEDRPAVALMSQMRLIDTKRLVNKIGFLDKETFNLIRKTAKGLL